MNAAKTLIIDVDTGIDDALALILASKKLKDRVVGITTCGGNARIEDTTANTLKIAELLGWDVPVYQGASKSSDGSEFVHAYDYHGSNGICDVNLPLSFKKRDESAVDFIVNTALSTPGLEILCLAAPTNLALALEKDLAISKNIKAVYIMGGAINVPGNQTEFAEYNFFQDPKGVETVLKSIRNVFIIPLDVTNRCCIGDVDASRIKADSSVSSFLKEAIINWYRFFGFPKKRQFELYDPLALSVFLEGDFMRFSSVNIGINTSGLRAGEIFVGGSYPVQMAVSVDPDRFLKFFLEASQVSLA